jgi:hypothetical protein
MKITAYDRLSGEKGNPYIFFENFFMGGLSTLSPALRQPIVGRSAREWASGRE